MEFIKVPLYNNTILNTWKIPITSKYTKTTETGTGIFSKLEENTEEIYQKSINENPQYFSIKDEYMKLIHDFRENVTDQFIGGMPVQLQKNCMSQLLRGTNYTPLIYGITLKVNGVRHLMFLSKSGIIYFIDRVTNFYYFMKNQNAVGFKPSKKSFLFDGELVFHKKTGHWEFLVFDVIFYDNFNWLSNNYYDRLWIMDKLNREFVFKDFDVTLKMWFPIETIKDTENIYKHIIASTNAQRKRTNRPILEEDGLILQPFDGNYITFREWNVYNNVQFKWKPPEQLTIDFEIKFNPESKKEWWLLTKSKQNYDVKQSDGTAVHAIILPTKSDILKYNEGDVVECILKPTANSQHNIFIPMQKRADKTDGNSLQTIMSTMDAIKNKFTLDILKPAILEIISGKSSKEVLQFYSTNKLILCVVDNFFTKTETEKIKEIYNLFDGTQELEFRIYPYIKGGKKENVQKFTYYYLLDFLKKSGMPHENVNTIDILLNNTEPNKTYRSTYSDLKLTNPINQVKTKISDYRCIPTSSTFPLTFKLSLSSETDSPIVVTKSRTNLTRIKLRDSFIYHSWRIDITKVISIDNDISIETYEIECEYIGKVIPFQKFIESMSDVYKLILKNTNYC